MMKEENIQLGGESHEEVTPGKTSGASKHFLKMST